MLNRHIDFNSSEQGPLLLQELVTASATCVGIDPGPDPAWFPEPFPDDEPDEED
jgi:hypothetical protein